MGEAQRQGHAPSARAWPQGAETEGEQVGSSSEGDMRAAARQVACSLDERPERAPTSPLLSHQDKLTHART
jgi:hypothetical protein